VEEEVEGFKEGLVGANVEAIDELVLVDTKPDKLYGEMLDLQHAVAFLPHTKIHASIDYAVTVGSDLCIITARDGLGLGESGEWEGEVKKNKEIKKKIKKQYFKKMKSGIEIIVEVFLR
jgi:malate/lactate dehydrogenase